MAWQNPNWVDYSIIALVILSALVSLLRGFVREALALATWVAAFWVALHYASLLADTPLFNNYLQSDSLRLSAAFTLLLISTLFIGALVNFLCSRLVAFTGLGGTDRLIGVTFGIARGILLVSAILLAAQMMNLSRTTWWQSSRLIPQMHGIMAWLQGFIPAELLHQAQVTTASSANTSSEGEQ
jgi:membrane protein required for colicin V production